MKGNLKSWSRLRMLPQWNKMWGSRSPVKLWCHSRSNGFLISSMKDKCTTHTASGWRLPPTIVLVITALRTNSPISTFRGPEAKSRIMPVSSTLTPQFTARNRHNNPTSTSLFETSPARSKIRICISRFKRTWKRRKLKLVKVLNCQCSCLRRKNNPRASLSVSKLSQMTF